jgi:hypothetical protein
MNNEGPGQESENGPHFFVNERKGRVDSHGETLTGAEILARVQLSTERYELFPLEHGKPGTEIIAVQRVDVKPGDKFRATLRNVDYSW